MVSLNEKRSKIRYIVQNKTEWVDDGNKFGKKMLEKMGWTSGVGLGKNEDGRTEHIHMKFKDNLKGVGFVNGKYDDRWIEHSQSFDSVLQQLQQSHPSSSLSSLNNFNQNVQQTKTRFTYKKQSSGKDLSSRSNDELDCIFGWNKTNLNDNNQQSHQDKESEIISDQHYLTSTQTINDYFKEKSKKKALRVYQQSQSLNNHQIDQVNESLSCEQSISNDPINEIIDQQNESIQEKRKKKKRDQHTEETLADFDQNEKKKKKKEENQTIIEDPYSGSNLSQLEGYQGWNIDSSFIQIIKKKQKQKKRKK